MTSPMFDYAALTPDDDTLREYIFDMIPGEPSIWCAPATDENKKYQNERLRIQIADAEATVKGKAKSSKLDVADMVRQQDKSIATDKALIARCCAKKWGKAPVATDGTQPEFSEANCLAFLKALPDYMFHPFNRYIGNIYNFVDRPPVDGDDLGNE